VATFIVDEFEKIMNTSVHVTLLKTTRTIANDIAQLAEMLPEESHWDEVRQALAIWRSKLENNDSPVPFVVGYTDVLSALLQATMIDVRMIDVRNAQR
jgi:hypothetical protein